MDGAAATLPDRQPHKRIRKLIERLLRELSLEEKLSLMSTSSPAINRSDSSGRRLWVPPFVWWGECGHGAVVDDEQGATIFPQVGRQEGPELGALEGRSPGRVKKNWC